MHALSAWLTIWILLGARKPMTLEKGPLNLSGEDYWEEPLTHKGDIGFKRIRAEADGMVLDAPPVVDLSVHSTIPVLCHRSGPTEKLFRFNLKTTAQLIVSHLETGDVQLTKLAPSPDRRTDSPPSPGWTTDWLEVDLDQKADLGPKMGRYAVWTVCGPEASNVRIIDLRPSGLALNSREFREGIRELNERGHAEISADRLRMSDFRHLPLKKAEAPESHWTLTPEPDPNGFSRLHLCFRIQGLTGFVYEEGKQPYGDDGRKIYGHIPALIFGFNPSRNLWFKSALDVPIVEMPSGPRSHPILSGNVTFRIPASDRKDFFAAPLDVWVTAMDQGAHAVVAAHPGKVE